MTNQRRVALILSVVCFWVMAVISTANGNTFPPESPVKLIFIHHSCGENWLADDNGGLGLALGRQNYFVSDTNYGWGPDGFGDNTDIGNWYDWFVGPSKETYMDALYKEGGKNCSDDSNCYSRMNIDPGGENKIIMFKSCFPNSHLGGSTDDNATTGDNPLRSLSSDSEHHTVANAKGVYNDLLAYFANHREKLFIAITAPPEVAGATNEQTAARAVAFNNWLENDWLDDYPHGNVAVYNFFKILANENGMAKYPTDEWDSHPSAEGNRAATEEFLPLMNTFYNAWMATNPPSDGDTGPTDPDHPAFSLYYPHVDTSGDWNTEICAINTLGDKSATGTFRGYADDGTLVSEVNATIPPHGRVQWLVGDTFATPDNIGYIVFEADSEGIVGYTKFYRTGLYRVAIPAISRPCDGDVYLTHIDSKENSWWTGFSLVNTTDKEKTLSIYFDNNAMKVITLGPKAHGAYTIRSLFGDAPREDIRTAIIEGANGMVGLELFGNERQLSGVLLKDNTDRELYFPHVDDHGDTWWTGFVAYNPEDTETGLTITPYSSDGTTLEKIDLDIPPMANLVDRPASRGIPQNTAWFKIEASAPITGFELFGAQNGNRLGGYTAVDIKSTEGIFPKLEKNGGWTGVAFVNITEAMANIALTAYDNNGVPVAEEAITLGPLGKIVDTGDSLFTGDISGATYIFYSADKEVVGFQINNDSHNMMLDALPALSTN